MKVTVIPILTGTLGTVIKGLVRGGGRVGSVKMSRNHQNYSILKIGQNTQNNPGDLRRRKIIS